jgi:hypothetical protein
MKTKQQRRSSGPDIAKGTNPEFKDSILANRLMDLGIDYYEKLGVSIAVLVGGGAVIKHAKDVFPILPSFAVIVGLLTMLIAMLLMVFISFRAWQDFKIPENRKLWSVVILASVILNSIFFFLAGGTAALRQITT